MVRFVLRDLVGDYSTYTFMEIYVWPLSTFDILFAVFWHSAALGLTKFQMKELMQ